MNTWRNLIESAMKKRGETMDDIVSITLTEKELDREFDDGYGVEEGQPFTAWTKEAVYFPLRYDGSEWVGSVSRHPDGQPT
ncbi:MAG: hypothetical protein EOM25_14510, partial [Deltaproteobacteria bacterium]|nr:hypothetical protein [Deltaproteobacteria bacterium]